MRERNSAMKSSARRVFDYFRFMGHEWQRVEYPSLSRFMDDTRIKGIRKARVDLFHDVKPSELSFLYYVTPSLFVTAQDSRSCTVFEYSEPFETVISEEKRCTEPSVLESAQARLERVMLELKDAQFEVGHGRYTIPRSF